MNYFIEDYKEENEVLNGLIAAAKLLNYRIGSRNYYPGEILINILSLDKNITLTIYHKKYVVGKKITNDEIVEKVNSISSDDTLGDLKTIMGWL